MPRVVEVAAALAAHQPSSKASGVEGPEAEVASLLLRLMTFSDSSSADVIHLKTSLTMTLEALASGGEYRSKVARMGGSRGAGIPSAWAACLMTMTSSGAALAVASAEAPPCLRR